MVCAFYIGLDLGFLGKTFDFLPAERKFIVKVGVVAFLTDVLRTGLLF